MDSKEWWRKAERPITLPKPKSELALEAERKNRRRLEREVRRLGWDSIEAFEASAEELGRRFPDMKRGSAR
jgi:hypothetical protein